MLFGFTIGRFCDSSTGVMFLEPLITMMIPIRSHSRDWQHDSCLFFFDLWLSSMCYSSAFGFTLDIPQF